MQYITHIIFWLSSAMESMVMAIGVAVLIILISLFGFGYGIGRIWNTKWKLNTPCILVSLPIALITGTLGAMWVGMGFINNTVLSKEARPSLIENILSGLTDNNRLVEMAFKSGLKKMLNSNSEIDQDLINEDSVEFVIPGETTEERMANEQAFLEGAMDAMAKGKKAAKGKSTRDAISGLSSMPPFSYGYAPISRDDANSTIYGQYTEAMTNAGMNSAPISTENNVWFKNLAHAFLNHNMKRFDNNVCGKLSDQRSSIIGLIIALLLVQTGLISWLAFIDIKPLNKKD